jgi:SsrA-binding protein
MADEKIIATNKKAGRDYFILESYEVGIQLQGIEVKSLREGKANLNDSFGRIERGEIFLFNLHIGPYSHISQRDYNPLRVRKLLLHKKEIKKLIGRLSIKGLTLVPLKMYFKHGIVKLELALCRGKKLYDKRRQLRKKAAQREIERVLKRG